MRREVTAETLHLGDKDLRKRMLQVVNRYVCRIEQLLAQAVSSGRVSRGMDTRTAALAFFALVHTTATLWALNNFGSSPTKRHRRLWEWYLRSLLVERPEPKDEG